jgi:hypothetical protein
LASSSSPKTEGDELRGLRDRLGLSDHQAAEVVRWMVRRDAVCPHCGAPLVLDRKRGADMPDDRSHLRDRKLARS